MLRVRVPLTSPRAGAFRAVLALLALVLGLGPALTSLHFALLQHEVCAAHGELVHADGGDHADHAPPPRSAQPGALPSASEEHEHEHCGVRAAATERAVIAGSGGGESLAPVAAAVRSDARREHARSSLDLLAYAPKLAPPV